MEREDRAARREMLGIEENEVPASQVGNRRYARGRAYDPDRFAVTATVSDIRSDESAPSNESPEAEEVKEEI